MKKLMKLELRSLIASASSSTLSPSEIDGIAIPDHQQGHRDREHPVAEGEHPAELGAVARVCDALALDRLILVGL